MAHLPDPQISFKAAVAVFQVHGAIETLHPKNQGFVKSLWHSYLKKGTLSPKQEFYLRVYAEKVMLVPEALPLPTWKVEVKPITHPAEPAQKLVSAPSAIQVGTTLVAMLTKAKAVASAKGNKKAPKIKFKKGENSPRIQFRLAGHASKYAGEVMITNGATGWQNTFYGRIDLAGNFIPNNNASQVNNVPSEIISFVCQFAKAPQEMGTAYGLATFHCCFCSKDITTVESKAAGYGPVCAANYGLPWGKNMTMLEGLGPDDKKQIKQMKDFWSASDAALMDVANLAKALGTPMITAAQKNAAIAKSAKAIGVPVLSLPEQAAKVALPLLAADKWIAAIKAVRTVTGWHLKEAKDFVETLKNDGVQSATESIENKIQFNKQFITTASMPGTASMDGFAPQVDDYVIVDDETNERISPKDLGFSCAWCLDTGHVFSPNGQLVACSKHEVLQVPQDEVV